MTPDNENLDRARRYLEAIGNGVSFDELAEFYARDVVQHEYPNQLVPDGARRNLTQLREAWEKGQQVVASQSYDILSAVAGENVVGLEVVWTATLKVPIGSIPAGGQMRAHIAMFLEYRDGRIACQRNYDCFERH
jgi:ketosteroid isomerase-like protein